MKRKNSILTFLVLVTIVTISYNFNQFKAKPNFTNLFYSNLSVLANAEGNPSNYNDCLAEGGNWNESTQCTKTGFERVTCKVSGKVSAFGVELSGSYEAGQSYNVPWAEYSCKASASNCCVKQGLYTGETKLA